MWGRICQIYDQTRAKNPKDIGPRNANQMKGRFKRLSGNGSKWVAAYTATYSRKTSGMDTDRDNFERHVTLEEIKESTWHCASSKVPGPDGYTFAFVKKFWGTIHKDIHEFVNSFFVSNTMPSGANSSFFTLIPKNLSYRLAKVIDKIVSKEQSAFITGRQILDGPLILSEIIEWYKKRNKKLLIFKVDFEKAFDSISWKFLDHILVKLGFGQNWCCWIKACLASSRASILVNGSLHNALADAVGKGLISGVTLNNSNINISHLFYADDIIITSEWNDRD
ncbi:RNA-directed DNA polymerase, eukaryota, reverse transcriptase zinc-binding domain protein [Tanacetum coccineum]|uniref:RNA-directed DNA polymerase, eukaryota, reverse transcriptase zinc-binding domain protein n=1 Tax=Tanacetum coccineum TaxID=301880 RepID=A0ABQ5H7E2_9ASTR